MSEIKFISDLHLGEDKINKYGGKPGFSSAEEYNEFVTDNIARNLGKRDVLHIMGDTCFTQESLKLLGKFKCQKKILFLGNHCLSKGVKNVREYLPYFDEVEAMKSYKNLWLTHAPLHPLELFKRCNVHGHDHAQIVKDPRYINVCCELIDYTPVTLTQIRNLIKLRRDLDKWIPSRKMHEL